MCCTTFLKPVYLANYLPLWLELELAGLSQQSLIACLVWAVTQSLLRGLGINVLKEFSSSDSGLLYHPKLITYQGKIFWKPFSPLKCSLFIFSLSFTSHVICNLSRTKISFLSLGVHKL